MNFGIVGTGMIADFHARAISEMEGSRIVACLDTAAGRAGAFGARHGCAAYADMASFLAHPGLEVVNVCTPSGAHLEPALAAARAGKHLIVEKPLEIDEDRCDRMIEACDRAGVALCGIFPSRFHEAPRAMKAAVDAGRFGRLTMGNAYVKWWRDQAYYDKGGWKGSRALDGGGALMNQSIHAVDLLRWLMGPVDEVRAITASIGHERIEVEDCAAAVLRFANGALGVVQGTTAAWPGFLKRIEVSGLDGSAVMEEENLAFWSFRRGELGDEELRSRLAAGTVTGGGASDPAAIGHHGHRLQFEDMVEAIRGGRKPQVDGVEARRAVEL
ncbi:MAG TPA: Gfo/Idh/MocA family oxidoreductase, partial [Rectinemataceae bacterium]|nr:Gfo/Idh/MocA family oxidoreductase [Rectinemataceae bacterium]